MQTAFNFLICLSFILFSSLELNASKLPSCWISNDCSVFESTPIFHLQSKERYVEKVHWEISNQAEFDWISPSLQHVTDSTNEVVLDKEVENQLIPGEIYFFRFKTELHNSCSSWSQPFGFSLGTPYEKCKEYNWPKKGSIDDASWAAIQPYLLPSNHPIRNKLDQIFSQTRATTNELTMKMAGFQALDIWKWDKVFVARHPALQGYLIKAYLDNHLYMDDALLINRIIGANALRAAIPILGYQNYFKVPQKWLYPLPDVPSAFPNLRPKNFILIVEDMNIVDSEKNKKMYLKAMDEKRLQALFHLLNMFGLADSIYIKNIPFSKDGKIAFVDTERHHIWPVPFKKLTPSLNPKMQTYWSQFAH